MASSVKNQIIGICRFSYLSAGGFAINEKMTREEAAEILFEPQRLRQRFAFFETLTLPSLAAQTDQDFTLVVLMSTGMPFRFRRRMRDLGEKYPFMKICALEPQGPLRSARRAFRRAIDPEADFTTGFRIDDDDAVVKDYIAKTRASADTLISMGWCDHEHPVTITYTRGMFWDMSDREAPFSELCESAPLGLATAMVTKPDDQSNVFRWNHRRLMAYTRVWSDPHEMTYLRTLHRSNDSDRSVPPGVTPIEKWRGKQILENRFGIDPEAAMPLMWRKFDGGEAAAKEAGEP